MLVPICLVTAGADPVQRVSLEGIDRRRPELIATAAAPAAQMSCDVGALGLHRRDPLELLPPLRGPGEQDPSDHHDHGRHADSPRHPGANLDLSDRRIEQEPQDPDGQRNRDRDRQHLIPLGRGRRVPESVDELVLAAGEQDEQRPADPSHERGPRASALAPGRAPAERRARLRPLSPLRARRPDR